MHRVTGKVLARLTADGVIKLRLAVSGTVSQKIFERAKVHSRKLATACSGASLDGQSKLQDCLKEEKPLKTGHGGVIRARRFTRYAAQCIRESAAVIERSCGTHVLFCTATLPGSTVAALKTLAAYSAYVTELLNQWIRDNAPGSLVVGVWELQKRGALHLHWAIGNTDKQARERLTERFHEWYCKLLERISTESGVDLFERKHGGTWRQSWEKVQTSIEPIRKSLSRYLSKYLTKSQRNTNNTISFPPSSWWSCSAAVKRLVKDAQRGHGSAEREISTAIASYEEAERVLKACSASAFCFENRWRPGERNVFSQFTWEAALRTWEWLTDWISRSLVQGTLPSEETMNQRYMRIETTRYWSAMLT